MIIQLPYVHNHDGTSKQIEEQTNLKSFYVEIAAEITPQNKNVKTYNLTTSRTRTPLRQANNKRRITHVLQKLLLHLSGTYRVTLVTKPVIIYE
jgi:hypothetical protein